MTVSGRPTSGHGLPAFAVLALADEIGGDPNLVHAFRAAFTARDAVMLAVVGRSEAESRAALGDFPAGAETWPEVRPCALDDPVLLEARALISGRPAPDWASHLPRVGGFDVGELRSVIPLAAGQAPGSFRFQCNLCDAHCVADARGLGREDESCPSCGSTVRLRGTVHLLTTELFGRSLRLSEIPERKDLVGIGMSDWGGYADPLAARLGYTNTFFHIEPRLDIGNLDDASPRNLDFVISVDVFEHVAPPVDAAFANLSRILKPNGLLVFSVPFTHGPTTVEHFPDLHDFEISEEAGRHVLRNTTVTGATQTFDGLVFHGGAGTTLEMRVFARDDLVRRLERAGFVDITLRPEPYFPYGVFWREGWSVPLTARTPEQGGLKRALALLSKLYRGSRRG